MGRRVYWGCVILVVMALRQQRPEGASIGKLVRLFGISRKTITRWIRYFKQIFVEIAALLAAGGRRGRYRIDARG